MSPTVIKHTGKRRRVLNVVVPLLIGSVLIGAVWLEAHCEQAIVRGIDHL